MIIDVRTLLMLLSMIWVTLFFCSCESAINKESAIDIEVLETKAKEKLMNLLASIENKDIEALEKIMSNSEEMDLIFTNGSILPSIDSFVEFHRSWFLDTTWTITHEVIDFKIYENFATSTVKAYYNEPDRDGQAYFHNMIVSYVLRMSSVGEWMVIKDQATTFDKTKVK